MSHYLIFMYLVIVILVTFNKWWTLRNDTKNERCLLRCSLQSTQHSRNSLYIRLPGLIFGYSLWSREKWMSTTGRSPADWVKECRWQMLTGEHHPPTPALLSSASAQLHLSELPNCVRFGTPTAQIRCGGHAHSSQPHRKELSKHTNSIQGCLWPFLKPRAPSRATPAAKGQRRAPSFSALTGKKKY